MRDTRPKKERDARPLGSSHGIAISNGLFKIDNFIRRGMGLKPLAKKVKKKSLFRNPFSAFIEKLTKNR